MSKSRVLLLVIICTCVASVAGALAGYYAALTTPVSASVAVLDIEAMARGVDPKSPDYAAKVAEVTRQAKAMTDKLVASGLVVLDRAQVVGAPEEAIIRVGGESGAAK